MSDRIYTRANEMLSGGYFLRLCTAEDILLQYLQAVIEPTDPVSEARVSKLATLRIRIFIYSLFTLLPSPSLAFAIVAIQRQLNEVLR